MKNLELQKRILSSLIIIPLTLFFIINTSIYFSFFLSIIFLLAAFEWIKMNTNNFYKFFGLIYLITTCYLIYLLRFNFPIEIFLMVLVICISTDLGGFIFGNILKGPKLTKISPKKTYSGLFGSLFLSLISTIIFVEFYPLLALPHFSSDLLIKKIELKNISILFILLISLASQIGDLIISYFKRQANIKDTGNLIPGHGGILDRIDGLIFAMPISYLMLIFSK